MQRAPHGVALAVAGARKHLGAGRGRDPCGLVGRSVVDHEQLIHQAGSVDELIVDDLHDRPHSRLLVSGREAYRNGAVALGLDEVIERELVMVEGAGHGDSSWHESVERFDSRAF